MSKFWAGSNFGRGIKSVSSGDMDKRQFSTIEESMGIFGTFVVLWEDRREK